MYVEVPERYWDASHSLAIPEERDHRWHKVVGAHIRAYEDQQISNERDRRSEDQAANAHTTTGGYSSCLETGQNRHETCRQLASKEHNAACPLVVSRSASVHLYTREVPTQIFLEYYGQKVKARASI